MKKRKQSAKAMSSSKTPTVIDLFAGAGGLTTGLKSAGFSVVAAVEMDHTSAGSYSLNHPEAMMFNADVKTLTGPRLLRAVRLRSGELSLLTACPPCQGFSTLRTRRRAKEEDPRNELIFEVLRLVRSIRPRALLIENVPGLAKNDRFSVFQNALQRAGYATQHAILDAQQFGVPQRRRRLVMVALRDGHLPENIFQTVATVRTTRDAIAVLPCAGSSGDRLHDLPERRSAATMARIRATPKDGGSRGDLPPEFSGCACHEKSDGYSDVYGRMAWDKVSPTITSGCSNPSKGRFLHPTEDRAITLREAALIQTFPRDYAFDLSRGKEHVAWQIGNAFPPGFIEPIARRLRAGLVS